MEIETFLLCFATIIWSKIFSTFVSYNKKKGILAVSNTLIKSIKYHLLSTDGIINNIKPYILLALKQGFLMPKEFNSNIHVKNAIELFTEAYNYRKNDFIVSHISIDIDENINCDIIDLWDIEVFFPDLFTSLILFSLFYFTENNKNFY